MDRLVLLLCCFGVVGCGPGEAGGTHLDCLPGGPDVVYWLLARNGDPPVAVEFFEQQAFLFSEDVQVWRPLTAPRASMWTITADDRYMAVNPGGLHESLDGLTWTTVGPGDPLAIGNGQVLGATSDGSYWFFAENRFDEHVALMRLAPGAEAWTAVFSEEGSPGRLAARGRDGRIWVSVADVETGAQKGLYRVTPDGSAGDAIYGCDDPELLYCTAPIAQMAVNEGGDLFYYLRNDISGDHVFFEIAAGTEVAVERGRLPIAATEEFPNGPIGAGSLAAVGDRVYITVRTDYEGGTAYLMTFDPGESEPRVITEVQDRNAEVVASSDGSHVYVHSPGVCELR